MNHKPIRVTVINHIKQPRQPNEPCICGSGKKFKKCCWFRARKQAISEINAERDAREQATTGA